MSMKGIPIVSGRLFFLVPVNQYSLLKGSGFSLCYLAFFIIIIFLHVKISSFSVLPIGYKFALTNQKHYSQIFVVMSHQYGISVLIPRTSFCGEINGRIVKCWLFSQAK